MEISSLQKIKAKFVAAMRRLKVNSHLSHSEISVIRKYSFNAWFP